MRDHGRRGERLRLLISWVRLRGAVPLILATFPLLAGITQADYIFNIVFFIVLTSALAQGTTLTRVARWLGLEAPAADVPPSEIRLMPAQDVLEVKLEENLQAIGKRIVDLELPPTCSLPWSEEVTRR